MANTWTYIKPLKTKDLVTSFTTHYGVKLPKKLVDFLQTHNGGRPTSPLFDTEVQEDYVFNSLFSYNEEDKTYIKRIYESIFKDTELYPIAIETSGDVICLKLTTKSLVLWKHESDTTERIKTESNYDLFGELL